MTGNVFLSGTGGRGHFLAPVAGKGNTGKMVTANQSSQVVSILTINSGGFFNAASTTDANPLRAGSTSAAAAIPLDAAMNGVFQTG